MPTINEVLERTARTRPCAIDDETKAAWLLELEGQLRTEFYPRYCPLCMSAAELEGPEKYPEDKDVPLSVPAPWDRVYDLYLEQMADFENREYANYNNALAMYEDAMGKFRRHYHRTHRPRCAGGCRGCADREAE